ncbi:MAG TPA: SLC13 family permease [Arenimonas sp.]|nr:SLC13 family permease [Arenimonas sp.]HOZ04938.1 SLC13 family permease [Arenimonas sp.]HPO24854.1 SLC13 family permease [Arenimonas sp.]HPW33109.1 SLC13 family permease [Arenimonas sp.]
MNSSITPLTGDMVLVLGLSAFVMTMFVFEHIRGDVTALVVLVILGASNLVEADTLFSGLSSNAVISIIASMILSSGLERTGALNRLAGWLLRRSDGIEERLILFHSAIAGVMSGFMQNPAVTALFLPVASRLSARTGIVLSRLLIPMATAIIMGGGLTMIGNSPLIMLNDLLQSANSNLPSGVAVLKPLPMFKPLPIGILLLAAGLIYFYTRGKKWLRDDEDKGVMPSTPESYFAKSYGIEGDVFELTVTAESPLVGMPLGEAEALAGAPLLLALQTGNDSRLAPPADTILWVGTVLGVMGEREKVQDYAKQQQLKFSARLRVLGDLFNPSHAGISEAVIPPTSHFIGRTQADLRLRKRFGISLLAIQRGKEVFRDDIRKLPIRAGDMLVFHSIWKDLAQASESRDFVVVTDYPKDEHRPHKINWAVGIFAVCMLLALTAVAPLSLTLMAGASAMVLSGVLNMDEAYASISWKTVFLMACLIPLGWAMNTTGAANWLAQHTLDIFGDQTPIFVFQIAICLLTTLFGLIIGNVGATIIMVPIGINVALAAGGNPTSFALLVALSASNNFMSQSNPVLAMISGPAGYQSREFWRTGAPLTLLYLIITLVTVNLVF